MTTGDPMRLADEQIEVLADRIAIRLAAARAAPRPMMTVEDLCARFQVSRAWVYENAGRLGGVKLGSGRRAPLRFEAAQVEAALNQLSDGPRGSDEPTPAKPRGRGRRYVHPVYDG